MHVLLVEDNPTDQQIIRDCVERAMPHAVLTVRSDCNDLAQLLGASTVDCVLLDNNLPTASGLGVLNAFKRSARNHYPPIVMLTGSGDENVAVEAMKLGAADYLSKNELSPENLMRAIRAAIDNHRLQAQQNKYYDNLARLSMVDAQTGLRNRAAFEDRLEHLVDSCKRYERTFALLVLDMTQIEPDDAPVACDAYMPEAAHRFRSILRNCDLAFRLDKNRFAALIETSGKDPAVEELASRASEVMSAPIQSKHLSARFQLTMGAAYYPESAWDSTGLISAANRALESARADGRSFEGARRRPAARRSWFKSRSFVA